MKERDDKRQLLDIVQVDDVYYSSERHNPRFLPRYLTEYCYRFNRLFSLEDMLPRLMYVALRTPPMPQKHLSMTELYG